MATKAQPAPPQPSAEPVAPPTPALQAPAAPLDSEAFMTALGTFLSDPAQKQRILSLPAIAGEVGVRAQAHAQRLTAQKDAEAAKESDQQKLERMIKDAEREAAANPDGFSAKWLKGIKKDRKQETEDAVRASVRTEVGEKLGKAIAQLPGFNELSPQDHADIAQKLVGKTPDEVFAIFAAATLDKLTDVRAAKLHGTWKEKDLDTETKARLKEANARKVATQQAPSLRPPTSRGASTQPRAGTPEWDTWYETTYLGRRA